MAETAPEPKKNGNRSIMEVLRRIDRGQFLSDLDKATREIARSIEENNGGSGEITIKVKLKAKASSDALTIEGDFSHKVPKRKRVDAILFLDPDEGELTPRDKRQPDLPSVVEADEVNSRRFGRQRDD